MKIIAFDIQTIPDLEAGRRLYGNTDSMSQLSDEDVGRVMMLERLRESDGQVEQLYPPMQRIIAVGVTCYDGQTTHTSALGDVNTTEVDLLQSLFSLLPGQLLVWDESNLAVLHYRCLYHNIVAPDYWSNRPLSVQAQLSSQPVPVRDMARLVGLPVGTDIPDNKIWETWLAGGLENIREQCANKALLSYALFLRLQHSRGELNTVDYQTLLSQLQE